jgi:hypothetical protein
MVNYNPDLQGWADRDEDPNWRENALARVRSRQKQSRRNEARRDGMYVSFDPTMRILIDRAAKSRNMGITAYARRCLAAFIAHDLGLPFTEVVRHTPMPNRPGVKSPTGRKTSDDGTGFGEWMIQELSER